MRGSDGWPGGWTRRCGASCCGSGRGDGRGLLPSPVAKQWEKVPDGRMRASFNGHDSRREALIRPVGHLLPSLRDGRRGWGERPRLFRHSGESRSPASGAQSWMPAFAGMTAAGGGTLPPFSFSHCCDTGEGKKSARFPFSRCKAMGEGARRADEGLSPRGVPVERALIRPVGHLLPSRCDGRRERGGQLAQTKSLGFCAFDRKISSAGHPWRPGPPCSGRRSRGL